MPDPWLDIVKTVLRQRVPPGYRVVAFGSRVTGERVKPHSDLDLCVMGAAPLDDHTLVGLRDAFTDSDLPIRVDVVDGATLTPAFLARVEAQGTSLAF